MRGHKYRVVNPVRFFIFILVTVLLLTFATATIINKNGAEASSVNTYMQVEVQPYDSLWSIAEGYCNTNMDMRDYVKEICNVNDIDVNGSLQPGDVVFVPLY